VVATVVGAAATATSAAPEQSAPLSSAKAATIIAHRADDVMQALQAKNMQHLASFVHPKRGVRFSPYAFVGTSDLVFRAEELHILPGSTTVHTWGIYDGIGTPITLTFDAYFQRFVCSQDFMHAEQISYNQVIGRGNTHDNSVEFYRDAIIVEYHFSGFDPKYGGMDWQSLRLVFQATEQEWYLVGIIHDEWTI
jgi:hypothetical protein